MLFSTSDITNLHGDVLEATRIGSQDGLRRRDGKSTLPGQPRIKLQHPDLIIYLRKAHLTPGLDKLTPHLWLVSTPHHAHISPLHHQATRGRTIIPAENPHLHLVWYYNRIFIQPIPPYLLTRAFWQHIQATDDQLFRSALGFMRSYTYLIQHESDFKKAVSSELGLIPAYTDDDSKITFEAFAEFMAPFEQVVDACVAPRFTYGELRLTRLNWLARVVLGKLTFHHMHAQWGSCLNRILAPFITVFVVLSTILNAMQVELAVQNLPRESGPWGDFAKASRWVAVVVLVLVALILVVFGGLVLFMFSHDLYFTRAVLRKKKALKISAALQMKSGVV